MPENGPYDECPECADYGAVGGCDLCGAPMSADRARGDTMTEVERLRRDLEVCREDRSFKHRQVERLAGRADDLQAEVERLRAERDESDRQWRYELEGYKAAHAEIERLREAITEALRWHVYSVERGDPDGNMVRIEKVENILRGALDAR